MLFGEFNIKKKQILGANIEKFYNVLMHFFYCLNHYEIEYLLKSN